MFRNVKKSFGFSAAVLDNTDSVGNGMVYDGTKCGDRKV